MAVPAADRRYSTLGQRYFAGFDYVAEQTGTYRLRVTSFEGVGTGQLLVKRG